MENNFNDQFQNDLAPLPERPQFLKVLCILSFIACGLMIIIYAIGTGVCLGMGEEAISQAWDKVLAAQPQFESIDPIVFFREVGKICLYNLFANILSLAGVIMMWRLNKIGFFVYAAAELVTVFFAIDMGVEGASRTYGSMIFSIVVDLVFIIMYAINLKHMNGGKQPQSAGI